MQNSKNFLKTKPILKPKPQQLILSIHPPLGATHAEETSARLHPQPHTQNRLPPNLDKEIISRKTQPAREKLSLRESVDYDKLSPSEQAKWDAGIYGSIHLKEDRGRQYYVVRWVDPKTRSLRSNKLGKTYEEAKATLKKMVLG